MQMCGFIFLFLFKFVYYEFCFESFQSLVYLCLISYSVNLWLVFAIYFQNLVHYRDVRVSDRWTGDEILLKTPVKKQWQQAVEVLKFMLKKYNKIMMELKYHSDME